MKKRRKCVNKRALVKFAREAETCEEGIFYLQRKGSFRELRAKCPRGTWMAWLIWTALGGETDCLNDDVYTAINDFVETNFGVKPDPLEYLADTVEERLNDCTTTPDWNKKLAKLIREKLPIEDVENFLKEAM